MGFHLGLILIVFSFPVFAQPIVSKSTPEILDLKSSIQRASNDNPRLLLAKKESMIAKEQLRQARSLFYPKVNLWMDYVRYRHETLGNTYPELGNVVLEAPIPTRSTTRANPLSENLYLGRVGFIQTLYAGGKLNTTYRLSKANIQRAESKFISTQRDVEFETADAFYRLLAHAQMEKTLQEGLLDLVRVVGYPNQGHKKFIMSGYRANFRQKLADIRQKKQNAKLDYLRAMGVELFSEIEVEGDFNRKPVIENLQTALVWAKQNRNELKESLIQQEANQLSIQLSLSERYPTFLLGGGVEVRDKDLTLEETNWNTALSMNIPIFDGFSSRARIRESRHRAEQGRLQRVQLEDQVEMEVRTTFSQAAYWRNETNVRRIELEDLETSRRSYLVSQHSKYSLDQRVDFLTWLIDARLSLISAQLEHALAECRLSKSIGKSIGE
ncbi:MAG: TolC family protein [Elusimicrobiota bacterium]